jgi:hypothetical protein
MSPLGPSRLAALPQNFGRFRSEADIQRFAQAAHGVLVDAAMLRAAPIDEIDWLSRTAEFADDGR